MDFWHEGTPLPSTSSLIQGYDAYEIVLQPSVSLPGHFPLEFWVPTPTSWTSATSAKVPTLGKPATLPSLPAAQGKGRMLETVTSANWHQGPSPALSGFQTSAPRSSKRFHPLTGLLFYFIFACTGSTFTKRFLFYFILCWNWGLLCSSAPHPSMVTQFECLQALSRELLEKNQRFLS